MKTKNWYAVFFLLLAAGSAAYAVDPVRQYSQTPASLQLSYKEVKLTASDGYKLKAWELQPLEKFDKKTTIVISYPFEGNMSSWLYKAGALAKAGYRVLLFDYRGFGQSQDFPLKKEQLYYNEFSTDLAAAVHYAKKSSKNNMLTGVLAFSEGSIAAVRTIQTEPVDFLILDGAVLDPVQFKSRIFSVENKTFQLPAGAEELPALYDKIYTRMLVFAGTEDSVTTVADARNIVSKNASNREMQVYNGDHLQAFDVLTRQFSGDYYINRITGFLAPLKPEEKKK